MRISVTLATNPGEPGPILEQAEWTFCLLDALYSDKLRFALDSYVLRKRETARHKFRVVAGWYRHGHNRIGTIKTDAVPLPDGVLRLARAQAEAAIEFATKAQ